MPELFLIEYLDQSFKKFLLLSPTAKKIVEALRSRKEVIINDHLALRTFSHPKVNIDVMARPFINWGYEVCGNYSFSEKKIDAIHLEHQKNPKLPKIFISELRYQEFGAKFKEKVESLMKDIPNERDALWLLDHQRPWASISFKEYEKLREQSEYAAWLYTMGLRPNHFALDVGQMESFTTLEDFNMWVKGLGIELNNGAGEIKGSSEQLLEQTATMADKVSVSFKEKEEKVRSCYLEFVCRYKNPKGEIFHGFLENSANKIFESTDSL